MTHDEALVILEELRGHGNAPFSLEQKQLIEELYPQVMGRYFKKTSCRRCYHDAVIEMTVRLRRTRKMEVTKKCNYHMRAGFIINSPLIDDGKIYTNANLTDDVAAKYLEMFPGKRDMFDVVPEEEPKQAETPVEEEEPAKASVQPEKAKKKAKKHKR